MRSVYLRRDTEGGCRGGVSVQDPHYTDYELEIGKDKNASPEMLALCALYDEILEFLKNNPSYLGTMLLNKHKEITQRLHNEIRYTERQLYGDDDDK